MIVAFRDVLIGFVAACIVATFMMLAPRKATCRKGMYQAHGVTPSGKYLCRDVVPEGREDEIEPEEYGGSIYCTGGSRPIVINERTVGCQR